MQIRSANRREGHLDDGVVRVDQMGVVDGLDANILGTIPTDGFHNSDLTCEKNEKMTDLLLIFLPTG